MGGIFINYRKGEHSGAVEALSHDLIRHFGADRVFLDKSSIESGERYPDALRRVADHEVLLVVIHHTWLSTPAPDGTRRIDQAHDWVREEIEIGLAAGLLVIPVLLGEARVPRPEELPESIRELSLRQAHRIRDFGADIDPLISKLERHVAPAWTPPGQPPRRRPARGPLRLAAGAAALLLVLPTALVLTFLDPYDEKVLYPTFYFLYISVLAMAMPLLYFTVVYFFRKTSLTMDREVQAWSIARFNRFTTPVILLFFLFATALVTATIGDWRVGLPLSLGFFVIAFFQFQYRGMRDERQEEKDRASWPRPLTADIHRDSFPPKLRRMLSGLRARVGSWTDPLSRDQRNKLSWALDHLETTMRHLRDRARRSRRQWLLEDHPRATSVYAVWVAATQGLVLALLVPRALDGTLGLPLLLDDARFSLAIGVVCAGTVELKYRYDRWEQRLLADEIETGLAEVGTRLR